MTLRNCGKHAYGVFEVFAKLKGGWPIVKSIRNICSILVELSKISKTWKMRLRNAFDERQVSQWFSTISTRALLISQIGLFPIRVSARTLSGDVMSVGGGTHGQALPQVAAQ